MRKNNTRKFKKKDSKYLSYKRDDLPFVIKRASRSNLFDFANNCYADYSLADGSLILGHAFPNSVLAAKKTAEKGIGFSAITAEEIDLEQFLVKTIKSVERVDFFASEKEALLESIYLSRGFTRKNKIIKFKGSHDFLNKYFPSEDEVINVPYNDLIALKKKLEQYKDSASCVIIEPVVIKKTLEIANPDILRELSILTKHFNVLLIFDEIRTCFRTNLGGFQHEVGISPDIICFGKILSSGFSIGALGGRSDIVSQRRGVSHISPLILKASLETLKYLKSSFYGRLNNKCQKIKDELNPFFEDLGVDTKISSYGSLMHISIASGSLRELSTFLIKKGIYFPQREGIFYISLFHTKNEIEHFIASIMNFFKQNKL